MAKVLYISYDGMFEPLGRSQVLSYLEKLSYKHTIVLISYEKPIDWKNKEKRSELISFFHNTGIIWKPLRYHKRFSAIATAYDILRGVFVSVSLMKKHKLRIVHARSYVPAVIALIMKKLFRMNFVFDMRGFWADERIDGGLINRKSLIFKIAKKLEKKFLLNADCVVSLTHAAIDEMKKFPYLKEKDIRFEQITTCANLDLFKPSSDKNIISPFTLGYVGSVGVWYLFGHVLKYYKILRELIPDIHFHIINRDAHDYIYNELQKSNIDLKNILVESLDHRDIPDRMKKMNAGIFFCKPTFSKKASAPTKLGEFLGCGIPCIANSEVGDMEDIIVNENVGVVLKGFSEKEMRESANKLIQLTKATDIKKQCRDAAEKHFSLATGVNKYNSIYDSLKD